MTSVSKTSISIVSSISRVDWGGSGIGGVSVVGNGSRVRGMGNDSNVVGVAGGVSVGNWKSSGDLSNGIGLRVSFGLTLAIVVSVGVAEGGVSSYWGGGMGVSIMSSSISRVDWGGSGIGSVSVVGNGSRVGSVGDYSNIVGVAGGVGVGDWKSSGDLSNGVGLRVSLSFTLAVVDSVVNSGGRDNSSRDNWGVSA